MASTILYILLFGVFSFCIGTLFGLGLTTKEQDRRGRELAKAQRSLNEQFRVLREGNEADEDNARWIAKEQSGLIVLDYLPVDEDE